MRLTQKIVCRGSQFFTFTFSIWLHVSRGDTNGKKINLKIIRVPYCDYDSRSGGLQAWFLVTPELVFDVARYVSHAVTLGARSILDLVRVIFIGTTCQQRRIKREFIICCCWLLRTLEPFCARQTSFRTVSQYCDSPREKKKTIPQA